MRKSVGATIGLVLSGGGAKGAYQAGVWKAMVESGVAERVKAISGTSVGAINAAAIASVRNPQKIKALWHNRVSEVVTPNFKAFSPLKMLEVVDHFADGKPFPLHGLLDRDALEKLLAEILGDVKWNVGNPAVYVTALESRGGSLGELDRSLYRKICFRLDEKQSNDVRIKKILASSAIPLCFSPVELDGKRYVDGGWNEMGGENVPVTPLLHKHPELSTIVVVRCNSRSIEPEPLKVPNRTHARIIEIRPKKPLPGIFDIENLGGGVLLGALIPGIVAGGGVLSLVMAAIGGLFESNRAKSWGATFAFSSSFTDRYFVQGYEDGIEALQDNLKAISCFDGCRSIMANNKN